MRSVSGVRDMPGVSLSDGLLSDPGSLSIAVLAVVLTGLSKGGLGGAMALLGTAILSIVVPPVQAAAILLPILVLMDWVSLWSWWGKWDRRTLIYMVPGGVLGIGIGWLTAALVSDDAVRLIVGLVALLFVLRWVFASSAARIAVRPHSRVRAAWWSTIAGYTSFVAHAGGPPYQIYTMPLRATPQVFTATSVLFFAIMNLVKLIPYFALGQLDRANLAVSAALMPLAVVSVLAGAAIVRRMRAEVFYPVMYTMVFLVSLRLLWDGFGL